MKIFLICLIPSLLLSGCWAKGSACEIVKVASDVCTVVEYTGEDGKTYRVKLSKKEVEQLAAYKARKDGLPAPKRSESKKEE